MTAQRIGSHPATGDARDLGFVWSLGLGIGLIVMGLLGFVPNPIVGGPTMGLGTPVFLTGSAQDVLHLIGGAVLLYGALGLTGPRRAVLLMGVGAVLLIVFLLCLLSGDLFGLLAYPVNVLDQLLHLVVGSVSIGVGYVARNGLPAERHLTHRDVPSGRVHAPVPDRPRPARTADARPAHLGHRPLQLPVHLLHAQRGVRSRVPLPAARRPADVRGDRPAGPAVRRTTG